MAYDPTFAERVRRVAGAGLAERKMFGGLCFLVGGNMAFGVTADRLMVRVGAAAEAEALAQPHTRQMDFTGRPLRGFVFVEAPGLADDDALAAWIARGVRFAASLPPK